MSAPITIIVSRNDGAVTRLQGHSGIAVVSPDLNQELQLSDPGTVSLRCSTHAEIGWNLACMLAMVRSVSPEAYDIAHELERFIDPSQPQIQHTLPRWTP